MAFVPEPEEQLGPISRDAYWQPESFTSAPKIIRTVDNNEWNIQLKLQHEVRGWGSQSSKDPHTWGFVLYTACSAPELNERVQACIEKLKLWMHHWALNQRYAGLQPDQNITELDARPTDGKMLPSHDLARRFKLDIINEYPGRDTIVANAEDGDEDFSAIGRAFAEWVDENALDISNLYVRNDHCLIIDEKALRMLEALPLPGQVPSLDKCGEIDGEGCECFLEKPLMDAWVWMLDREYFEEYAEALASGNEAKLMPNGHPEERRFEPWVRIHISDLPRVWFSRPLGLSPATWESVVARDEHKFDLVNWWGDAEAPTTNELHREHRKPGWVLK